MQFLRKIIRGGRERGGTAPPFDAPFEPSRDFFAIGDLHGCMDKLDAALDMAASLSPDPTIVCVGDYLDRGEDSSGVLGRLFELSQGNGGIICLMGNHERMFLDFLDDPRENGSRWLRYGGLQTLASFRLAPDPGGSMTKTRDALVAVLDPAMIDWLRNLPPYWITGNVAVTHAGADPALGIGAQPVRNLIWGHPQFETTPRDDGMWVVHGHSIVETPHMHDGRIAIDTGAYATGRLTLTELRRSEVRFHTI